MTDAQFSGMPEGLPENFVPPDGFIAPSNTALHIESNPVPTDHGEGRVMIRTETIHGSHVCFALPDVAIALGHELIDAGERAKLIVFGDTPDKVIIPPRNRQERRHGVDGS